MRTYVLSLPSEPQADGPRRHVTENGGRWSTPTLVPASQAAKKTFGVVLVLDTSYSMTGKPIAAALAAAQAFVAQRNPNEQVGVDRVQPRRRTSCSRSRPRPAQIDAALAKRPRSRPVRTSTTPSPRPRRCSAAAHISSGSIVVLSDGADTGSTHQLGTVAKVARIDRIKIYAIGLKSQKFDSSTLTSLASKGAGEYALASSTAQLSTLFNTLGARLSQQYVLQYKSLASPRKGSRSPSR